jgi:hypothetical protein
MKIADLINLAQQRLIHLERQRGIAVREGDISQLNLIDSEIADTSNTLAILNNISA